MQLSFVVTALRYRIDEHFPTEHYWGSFESTDFKCHVKIRDGKIPRTDPLNGPKPEGVGLVLPI